VTRRFILHEVQGMRNSLFFRASSPETVLNLASWAFLNGRMLTASGPDDDATPPPGDRATRQANALPSAHIAEKIFHSRLSRLYHSSPCLCLYGHVADELMNSCHKESAVSWVGFLKRVQAEEVAVDRDPLTAAVTDAVCDREIISTAALLDLVGLRHTTGDARRVGKVMRSLGYVPIKSRKLLPGGFRDTVARGWARPVRDLSKSLHHQLIAGTTGANQLGG
jgi:hypothetical protein